MNFVSKFFRKLTNKPTKVAVITNKQKIDRYMLVGFEFSEVIASIYFGECVGFEGLLESWEAAERDYAELGFRTLPIDFFVGCVQHDDVPNWYAHQARDLFEKPVYHAAEYRERYLKGK